MKTAVINQLHAEAAVFDQIRAALSDEIATHSARTAELNHESFALNKKWSQNVISIGRLLNADKAFHGKGWKVVFGSHRLPFDYKTACRYMACANHPELCTSVTTIEAWAKLSGNADREQDQRKRAKKEKRKQRAAARAEKEQQLAENLPENTAPEHTKTWSECWQNIPDTATAQQARRELTQVAFDSLYKAIETTDRFKDFVHIGEHW